MNFERELSEIDWTDSVNRPEKPLDILKAKLSKEIDHLERKLVRKRTLIKQLNFQLTEQIKQFQIEQPESINFRKARDRRSILVYNISEDAELGELRSHFEICGNIENIVMLFDKDKFLSRACVIFKHEAYAYVALCMNKTDLVGQKIRVLPWNLNFPLEVIQLIVKKWGTMLEDRFELISDVRHRLRVVTAITKHRYELMALYLKATMYSKNASIEQLQDLICESLSSLDLLGKYPLSYLECDENVVF